MSSRTNFEALALTVKSLALRDKSRAPQSQTNYDMKAVKAPCNFQLDSFGSFEPLTLFNEVFIA